MIITVLSGADRLRFPTMINHKIYADSNGYRYCFDMTPSAEIRNPYFHKVAKIKDSLPGTDWLFWIDDDAAFTQIDKSVEEIVPEIFDPEIHIIFCRSPVNPQGGWTYISSGNFLIRNSEIGRNFIAQASETLLPVARDWWDSEKYGMFTNGDQDVLVYVMENNAHIKRCARVLTYDRFNTRPYHFVGPDDHFIIHFTHRPDLPKLEQMQEFCSSHHLTPFLVDRQRLAPYEHYVESHLKMFGLQG